MSGQNITVLRILHKDIEKKYVFFKSELEHIKKVAEFLGQEKFKEFSPIRYIKKNKQTISTSLSSAFKNIFPILYYLDEEINNIEVEYKALTQYLNNLENQINNDEKTFSYYSGQELNYFFNSYTKIKNKLDLITDKFNFLQRKIINIINSFPFYYPTPKVSSYKEASKIHFFLEWISLEFLNFLKEEALPKSGKDNSDLIIYSNFYWNFEKEIRFIPDIEYIKDNTKIVNFIISSDSYLPYRRSHYILIFHECLHFYFKFLDKEFKNKSYEKKEEAEDDFPEEFKSFRKHVLGVKSILEETGIGEYLDFDDIIDIFIDSILTKVFDKYYYLPLFSHTFLYDENLFIYPNLQRKWYIRTKVPLNFLDNKENINNILEDYKNEQTTSFRPIESTYIEDERIILILKEYVENYMNRNKKLINKLKELKDLLKNEQNSKKDSEKNIWIKILLKYQKEYIDDILKNFYYRKKDRKKFYEGRTLAIRIHNRLLNANLTVDNDNINVYSFKYIKMRTNKNYGDFLKNFLQESENNGTSNNSLQNIKRFLFNYGSYSFLKIEKEGSEIGKEEKNTLNYSNNYELTLFDNKAINFDDFIQNCEEFIVINIKILLKRRNETNSSKEDNAKTIKDFKEIKDHFEKRTENVKNKITFIKDIKPIYFISFDWFDLFISLFIKFDENQDEINLNKLLSEIKENFIVNEDFIHRSETEIFLGRNIIKKLNVNNLKMQIRLSGKHDKNIINNIDEIFKKINNDVRINYLYGIRDIEVEYEKTISLKNILYILSESDFIVKDNISDIQFIPSTLKSKIK